jgi:pimeloyl-ACP methyl ester carboxylesterase
MAAFIFVHGAFQGGWVWKDVAAELRARGHETHTPTLTNCGYLSHGPGHDIGLETYIGDITEYLGFEAPAEAVLVGHSYSGMICGAVMMRAPDLLKRAVFVDAVIPEKGRSFADIGGDMFKGMLDKHRTDAGTIRPWPLPVFGVTNGKTDWFAPRLKEFPEAAFTTPFPEIFKPDLVKTAFIACSATASPFIKAMPGKARAFGWPVYDLESAHSPMTTHPLALADLLETAALS